MVQSSGHPKPEVKLHVLLDGAIAIGPVQASLLEAIRTTGSISAAHRQMRASYAYVWRLVAGMNLLFSSKLVDVARGLANGGGACLTEKGLSVLSAFRRLEALLANEGGRDLRLIAGSAAAINARSLTAESD
jgi:molybdate transport system regulatory protein